MQANIEEVSIPERIPTRKAPVPGPRHLLLAEDDGQLRYLLSSALRNDGHQIVSVSNGVDLMDILGESLSPNGGVAPFDLVLSDLHMPGWPGLEALEKIGRNPAMPPFILFTAFGDEETHRRALEIGALVLLDKPFEVDCLRALVARVLAQPSEDPTCQVVSCRRGSQIRADVSNRDAGAE